MSPKRIPPKWEAVLAALFAIAAGILLAIASQVIDHV